MYHLQESWDFLAAAMFQPGFDAVVIELGNSRHQALADDYVNGEIVRRSHLQKIWRDTTQSSARCHPEVVQRLDGLTVADPRRPRALSRAVA